MGKGLKLLHTEQDNVEETMGRLPVFGGPRETFFEEATFTLNFSDKKEPMRTRSVGEDS